MKSSAFLLLIALLGFCWGGVLGDPIPASGQTTHRLQVSVIKGQFLAANGESINEYDYLEPGHKYRLLPKTEVQLSTLDGKKTYEAVGPGVVFLDSSGSVLFNGNALKPKARQSLLQNVTASKIPTHELAGLPFRGIKVVARTEDGGTKLLPLYSGYQALVVGVGNYDKWPKLPNAVHDAKDVGEKLKKLGFDVKLILDPTSSELMKALNDLTYRYGRDKNQALLFFYAGHGETELLADGTKLGYIIPRDCPLLRDDPDGFVNRAISMKDIEAYSLRIRSKHVLMLFDSCFSGALFALIRAVPHDITEKSTMPVRQYITAGREDEEVPDRSMFKRCLLIGLDGDADLTGDGYITGSELGMYLADKVVNYTNRRQHPQYGKINNPDLDRGDFIFVPVEQRLKEAEQEKERQKQELALAEQVKRIQEQMKALLEKKWETEKKTQDGLTEKRDLEEKLRREADEHRRKEALSAAKIRDLEAKHKASLEKLEKEAAAKTALAEELKRQRIIEKELKQAEGKRKKDEQLAEERIEKLEAERMAVEKQLRKEAATKQVLEGELRKKEAIEEELNRVRMQQHADKELAEIRVRELEAERLAAEERVKKEAAGKKDLEDALRRKGDIEQQLKRAEKERAATKGSMVAKITDLDKKRKEAEEKALKETTAKKALEDELNRVKSKLQEATQSTQKLKAKQAEETRVAYIPKKAIPDVLSPGSPDTELTEIGRDGHFVAYANGTVLDTKTNLMWAATDAGVSSKRHSNAKAYCKRYREGGHTDWRMPTVDELETLYDVNLSNQHGYHVTELINVGADYIWADQFSWGGEAAFNFKLGSPAVGGHGDDAAWYSLSSTGARALPVRDASGMKPRLTSHSTIKHLGVDGDESSKSGFSDLGSNNKDSTTLFTKTVGAGLSPISTFAMPDEIAREGRFIAYGNGIVIDTQTNLMWADKDAGVDFESYSNANFYCEEYQGGGYMDWRMPTLDELETLYNEKLSNRCGYHTTKLIDVGSAYIWAKHSRWGGEAAFNFRLGSPVPGGNYTAGTRNWGSQPDPYSSARALPVRDTNGMKHKKTSRDGRFIAYDNGTVLDAKTGLIWAARDSGKGLVEHNVKDYIANYRAGGYTDWRLPTMNDLKAIYNRDLENKHGYHVTRLIDITGEWVWGSEGWGGEYVVYDFTRGSPAAGDHLDNVSWSNYNLSARVLPVRGGNKP
jgi:uncharacterized caspase-like protein